MDTGLSDFGLGYNMHSGIVSKFQKKPGIIIVAVLFTILLVVVFVSVSGEKYPANPLFGGTVNLDWKGDRIFLGSYEQDGDESNGKEPVLWRILSIDDHSMLLLSEYALDVMPFHGKSETATWETSDVREWLNSDFLENAFSKRGEWKPDYILNSTCNASVNPYYGTDGGTDTEDRIFLMSWQDMFNEGYGFPGQLSVWSEALDREIPYGDVSRARICYPSLYTAGKNPLITRTHDTRKDANGSILDGFGSVYYILRTPGMTQRYISYVSRWGRTTPDFLSPVDHDESTVRPALWVDLTNIKIEKLSKDCYFVRMDDRYADECKAAKNYSREIKTLLDFQDERPAKEISKTCKREISDLVNPVFGGNEDGEWEGDRVLFGAYKGNPVLWRVIQTDEKTILLLSEYGLESKSFSKGTHDKTWEKSYVREWMNTTLVKKLFNKSERAVLLEKTIENKRNPRYGTYAGTDTTDLIYLLSWDECVNGQYGFNCEDPRPVESNTRICYPIAESHNQEQAVFGKRDGNGNQIWVDADSGVRWMLRTPGFDEDYISDVDIYGDVYHHEQSNIQKKLWIRPVICVDKTKVSLMGNDDGWPVLVAKDLFQP